MRCAAADGWRCAEPSRSTGARHDGPANLFQATANDLTLRGFRGSSHLHRMGDMLREVRGWLADGRLRYRETIVDGLERAPDALARTLAGDTIGKTAAVRQVRIA